MRATWLRCAEASAHPASSTVAETSSPQPLPANPSKRERSRRVRSPFDAFMAHGLGAGRARRSQTLFAHEAEHVPVRVGTPREPDFGAGRAPDDMRRLLEADVL